VAGRQTRMLERGGILLLG